MITWLVEEHTTSYGGISERIAFVARVLAETAQQAFDAADRFSKETRKEEFAYKAEDLTEVHSGYLWVASDGSNIWYEIRGVPETVPFDLC